VTNLRISLTSRCNLSCIYCHAEGEKNPEAEMSTDEIIAIMQTAAKFGIRSIKFTGGEPLIRPDILQIVRAVPKGIEASITTNGILLADMAADLKAAGTPQGKLSASTA